MNTPHDIRTNGRKIRYVYNCTFITINVNKTNMTHFAIKIIWNVILVFKENFFRSKI